LVVVAALVDFVVFAFFFDWEEAAAVFLFLPLSAAAMRMSICGWGSFSNQLLRSESD